MFKLLSLRLWMCFFFHSFPKWLVNEFQVWALLSLSTWVKSNNFSFQYWHFVSQHEWPLISLQGHLIYTMNHKLSLRGGLRQKAFDLTESWNTREWTKNNGKYCVIRLKRTPLLNFWKTLEFITEAIQEFFFKRSIEWNL